MPTHIGQIALLVNDYDEAIEYFVNVLQFSLVEDTILSDKKRKHPNGCFLFLLCKASPRLFLEQHEKKNLATKTIKQFYCYVAYRFLCKKDIV